MELVRSSTAVCPVELVWGGKLPSMGDFVWSDGCTALRTRLDNWLAGAMYQFRLAQGNNWQGGFDQAPVWNFIVPAGIWDQGCIAGCVSPSCDRVGRRFPFIVAYKLPARLPVWFFAKTVNLVPSLLARTGVLLFNGIRRRWLKAMLIPLIEQALISWWKELQPWLEQHSGASSNDSVIMDVLLGDAATDNTTATVPNNRSSSFPWGDVTNHLGIGSVSSFWWTNGAGNASLKAFDYGIHPDGALMTWLFGRSSV